MAPSSLHLFVETTPETKSLLQSRVTHTHAHTHSEREREREREIITCAKK